MRKLLGLGLVVGLGQHAKAVEALREVVAACEALSEYIRTGIADNQQRKADAAVEKAVSIISEIAHAR